MRIGLRFARELAARGLLPRVAWIEADLYGSLALTGRGHGTDRAVVMGLMGLDPATVDPHAVAADVEAVRRCGLPEKRRIAFLSRGMRAQLALILAVSGRPDVLVFDDPAMGLDVAMRRELLDESAEGDPPGNLVGAGEVRDSPDVRQHLMPARPQHKSGVCARRFQQRVHRIRKWPPVAAAMQFGKNIERRLDRREVRGDVVLLTEGVQPARELHAIAKQKRIIDREQ